MTTNPTPLPSRGGSAIVPSPWAIFLLALPWLLAAYIAYIFLWYLPFKFYPDSYLFQILEDWAGRPWFEPYFRYFTGGVEAVASLLLLGPGLQVAGAAGGGGGGGRAPLPARVRRWRSER